jgi:hypothetical protein
MEPVIPGAHEVVLTTHAVERYQECLCPTLGFPAARRELERLRESGQVVTKAPAWLDEQVDLRGYFLEAGPDIVMPLAPHFDRPDRWVALTCIVKGAYSGTARAA